MSIPNKTETLADLAPYLDSIRQFFLQAWNSYHDELPAKFLLIFGSRSRASNLHDLTVHFASEFVSKTENATAFERQQMHGIVLLQKYAIRFKKIDEGNRSKNQPSDQVRAYREHIGLEGIDAIHHLELGYILDTWQQKIVDIRLVCPAGDGTAWAESLMGSVEDAVIESNIFEIPREEAYTAEVLPSEITPVKDADILPFKRKEVRGD